MALHHEVLRDIRLGRIPWSFKTADLMRRQVTPGRYLVGDREFSANTLKTVPRNHSTRPDGSDRGDYVRKGRQAAFFWTGPGQYELILDTPYCLEDRKALDDTFIEEEGEGESLICTRLDKTGRTSCKPPTSFDESRVKEIAGSVSATLTSLIARYLAEAPFQAYCRRKPHGPLRYGLGERLDAYFWPAPERDWAATCPVISNLSAKVQGAIRRLQQAIGDEEAATDLLKSFKETCVWGGVRLPESDPHVLAREVLSVYEALTHGQRPTSDCRLNSAWTKLYALALPDTCVIYDSRVASALTSILDPAMDRFRAKVGLGTIPGRGGSRPRPLKWPWPSGYQRWTSQIAANRLCVELRDEINRQSKVDGAYRKLGDSTLWTLREVEAVLFMEGY
jgi:hypothetical protein